MTCMDKNLTGHFLDSSKNCWPVEPTLLLILEFQANNIFKIIGPCCGDLFLFCWCYIPLFCWSSSWKTWIVGPKNERKCLQHFGKLSFVVNMVKVVLGGYHRNFFGVKVKTVNLIGFRRYLAVRSGLNARIYFKWIFRLLVRLQPPAGK